VLVFWCNFLTLSSTSYLSCIVDTSCKIDPAAGSFRGGHKQNNTTEQYNTFFLTAFFTAFYTATIPPPPILHPIQTHTRIYTDYYHKPNKHQKNPPGAYNAPPYRPPPTTPSPRHMRTSCARSPRSSWRTESLRALSGGMVTIMWAGCIRVANGWTRSSRCASGRRRRGGGSGCGGFGRGG
jgi:hypothetical protein